MKKLPILCVMIIFCIGCQNKEPEKHVNNFEIIDELEPIGMKIKDEYQTIDLDKGYEIYKKSVENFYKAEGIHAFVSERNYTENNLIYGADIKITVNDFNKQNVSAIMEHTNAIEDAEQTIYLKDNEFYFHINDTKMNMIGFPNEVLYQRFLFLNVKKDQMKRIKHKAMKDTDVYYFLLKFSESNKKEFFTEYSSGNLYPLLSNVHLFLEIDHNDTIKESMIIYKIDYFSSEVVVKNKNTIDNYFEQNIRYPSDLEQWRDVLVHKEDLDKIFNSRDH